MSREKGVPAVNDISLSPQRCVRPDGCHHPATSCAFADCGEPSCGVCSVLRRFPPIVRCDVLIDGHRCRWEAGHPEPCRSDSGQEKRAKPTRDGVPKLGSTA